MRTPSVSVVVPTFDRAAYLGEALRSVLCQTYRDLELIVVDDGSTDGSDHVLSAIDDPRFRSVRIPHSGLAARARNAGIEHARGFCLAFLDSDDLWHPMKLELQAAALEADAEAGWSYTLYDHIDAAGADAPPRHGGVATARSGWILDEIVTGEALVLTQSLLVRAQLLRDVGGFDEDLVLLQDFDMALRLARRARGRAVDRVLVRVRRHAGRTTHGRADVHWWRHRALAKLAASGVAAQTRRLCRRESLCELCAYASARSGRREHAAALAALARAFRYGAVSPAWWVTLARSLARPFVPEGFLRRRRAARGLVL